MAGGGGCGWDPPTKLPTLSRSVVHFYKKHTECSESYPNYTHHSTIHFQHPTSMPLKIISAGAGSGKTYRLTQEMVALLKSGVRASGIIATTFTTKAAAELQERVRVKLLQEGLMDEANDLTNALIGTVHGLGVKLLKRFAFEAGVSPQVDIIADEDQQILFNKSLATVLTQERIQHMEHYSNRLGLNKRERYDWRFEVKQLTDIARANDFSTAVLEESKQRSFTSLQAFLSPISEQPLQAFNEQLGRLLEQTLAQLRANEDTTKKTAKAEDILKGMQNTLKLRGQLHWHEWVKIAKLDVGAKSKEDVFDLIDFAKTHDAHPEFHRDIEAFIHGIFDIAMEAIQEYDQYKKQRGLIDYIDMEIHVKRLLDNPQVVQVLSKELDLLMVDEFQDTSPIQLEIFLKLSKIAQHSIWVGDPKQSIYGFRGAEPRLMQAIIEKNGGVKPEDIQRHSWRSREDIVYLTNALFVKAFSDLPTEQVALEPMRTRLDNPHNPAFKAEPIELNDAIIHWHFQLDGEGRLPGKPWMENGIAKALVRFLDRQIHILPKGEEQIRPARPGDVAILCRSNAECQTIAEALHRAGLKAAISRSGLLSTAEARLILACLKFILNKSDSLSVAEILLLADDQKIEDIIHHRLEYLERLEQDEWERPWAADQPIIQQLHELREQVAELSSAEILNLLMEQLDLRRMIVRWGKVSQRMDNVDVLRKMALQYEEACNRLHTAASLGGFLLWLNELEKAGKDTQGSGEGPDAVNVMTYHRSKGLEWPVVICHSLEGRLRDKVWGMNIVSDTDDIDLDNILGNRWLRYWINPYSDQDRGTLLSERINASPIKKAATEQALAEEARLLYVGITRARDYLVFPTRSMTTRWLNRCWHQGKESDPTLDFHDIETPWEWNGRFLTKQTPDDLIFPRDFTQAEPVEEDIQYFAERKGRNPGLPYTIDLNRETFRDSYHLKLSNPLPFGSPLVTTEEERTYALGKVAKAILAADRLNYPAEERLQLANGLLQRHDVDDLSAAKLADWSGQFFAFLEKRFAPKRVLRKFPVRYHHQGRLFSRLLDLVLETAEGYVLIQHSGFTGPDSKWNKKMKEELSDFFYLAQDGTKQAFGTSNVQLFAHFVMGSSLLEAEIKSKKAHSTTEQA